MKKEISFIVTLEKMKLVSVNSMYNAGLLYKGGKPVPYIYKSAESKKFEAIMHEQLRALDWTEHMDWLRDTKQFTITQQYIFKTGINRRDCENCSKLVSDSFVRFIKGDLGIETFDDAKFSDLHLYKSIIPGSDKEYLCVKLSPSNFNMRFDLIQKPEQALVHVSETGPWEKEFKKVAKEKGLKYQLSCTDKKIKDHNTDIFFPDVSSGGWFSTVIEIMDWIYSHKDSGCFTFYGFKKPETPDQEKLVQQMIDTIHSFGIGSIKARWIDTEKDILDELSTD